MKVWSLLLGLVNYIIWEPAENRNFSFKTASGSRSHGFSPITWSNVLWIRGRINKHSVCAWLAIRNGLKTKSLVASRNIISNSQCVLCSNNAECSCILFLECTCNLCLEWHNLKILYYAAKILSVLRTFSILSPPEVFRARMLISLLWSCAVQPLSGWYGRKELLTFFTMWAILESSHWRCASSENKGCLPRLGSLLCGCCCRCIRTEISSSSLKMCSRWVCFPTMIWGLFGPLPSSWKIISYQQPC